MFKTLDMAPPDPIIGLTEAFRKDPNETKINLGVGVYKDAAGATPVLATVKAAERNILEQETTKNYLPIDGLAAYDEQVQQLLFGPAHEVVSSGRAVTVQTPGGTGALRVVGDFLHRLRPDASVWLSEPTWANHPKVFEAAGVATKTYPYYDAAGHGLAFDAMIEGLAKVPGGDVVLLHGCCHNPTGIDPTLEQWQQIGDVLVGRGAIALVDFAYQGFADGVDEDAAGLRTLCRPGAELFVCSSYSKNFGLYSERIGALSVVAGDEVAAKAALSHLKVCVRTNYSNPPTHGASIVATVLSDAALRADWEKQVQQMRDRINGMRRLFVEKLEARGVKQDFSFITKQRGMFSFSGLNKDQVQQLRDQYSIYIVGSGRINVAGMTEANMDRLCDAIAAVL